MIKYYLHLGVLIILFISLELMAQSPSKTNDKIGGFFQLNYSNQWNYTKASSFDIARAQLKWFGVTDEVWKYCIQVDLADANKSIIRDLYISWSKYKYAVITIGQTFIPFSIINEIPTHATPFIEYPIAYKYISGGRDLGFRIDGNLFDGIFRYAGGFYNGNASNKSDNNTEKNIIGKISISPFLKSGTLLSGIRIISGIDLGKYNLNDSLKRDIKRYCLGMDYKYCTYRIISEYYYQEKTDIKYSSIKSSGYFVFMSNDISLSAFQEEIVLEPFIQYEVYDGEIFSDSQYKNGLTVGINMHLDKNIMIRSNFRSYNDNKDRQIQGLIIQAQYKFNLE